MHRGAIVTLLAATALAGACSRSSEEQKAEASRKAADQVAKGAEGMAQSAEQMAKGMEQMAKGLQDLASGQGRNVKPVNFRDFYGLFPQVAGWEMGQPTGETITAPVTHSQASVEYRKGNSALEVRIVDSALSGMLLAPYAVLLQTGYEKETEFVRERAMKVKGYPGFEKWELEATDGELMAVVGNRFLVTVEGNDIENVQVLHDVMNRIDLAKLESMK